jgi:hypothetical protein
MRAELISFTFVLLDGGSGSKFLNIGSVHGAFEEGDGSAPLLSILKNKNEKRSEKLIAFIYILLFLSLRPKLGFLESSPMSSAVTTSGGFEELRPGALIRGKTELKNQVDTKKNIE